MKFPPWLKVFGDTSYRGDCPSETSEQAAFFRIIRRDYPTTWGVIALHPKNEGRRRGAAFRVLDKDKALGMTPGASDIIIPVGFVCELKRLDHTKSTWQDKQLEYLEAHHMAGGFACVALGHEAALFALRAWEDSRA